MRAWFRLLAVVAIVATNFASAAARAQVPALVDPPMFAEAVKAGKLPPVEQRVPLEPSIVTFDGTTRVIGRHGGMITQLMERSSDIKRMSAFGYTRLVGYTPDYRLQADILKSYEVKEGREFTLRAAQGPSLVGRPALHHRGLPLLLGGHGPQQGDEPGRRADGDAGQRAAAQGRDHRRGDDPLHLGQAQSVLPAGAGGAQRR